MYNDSQSFFEVMTKEKAYLCGLILTDGHVSNQGVKIQLSSKDNDILEKIHRYLDSCKVPNTLRLDYHKSHNPIRNTYSDVGVYGVNFRKWFVEQGICGNKTFTLKMPLIPDEFFFDFFRGVVDGDGWIHSRVPDRRCRNPRLELGVCSASRFFIVDVVKKVCSLLGMKNDRVSVRNDTIKPFYQRIFYSTQAYRILQEMYREKGLLYLDRKFCIYDRFEWKKDFGHPLWTADEDSLLLREYRYGRATFIAKKVNRTVSAVRGRYLVLKRKELSAVS